MSNGLPFRKIEMHESLFKIQCYYFFRFVNLNLHFFWDWNNAVENTIRRIDWICEFESYTFEIKTTQLKTKYDGLIGFVNLKVTLLRLKRRSWKHNRTDWLVLSIWKLHFWDWDGGADYTAQRIYYEDYEHLLEAWIRKITI